MPASPRPWISDKRWTLNERVSLREAPTAFGVVVEKWDNGSIAVKWEGGETLLYQYHAWEKALILYVDERVLAGMKAVDDVLRRDADWLLQNPNKNMDSKYRDAGRALNLADEFRRRLLDQPNGFVRAVHLRMALEAMLITFNAEDYVIDDETGQPWTDNDFCIADQRRREATLAAKAILDGGAPSEALRKILNDARQAALDAEYKAAREDERKHTEE